MNIDLSQKLHARTLQRGIAFLIALTLILTGMNAGLSTGERVYATAICDTVYIPDANLKAAINRALSAPLNADISAASLSGLTSLSADQFGIKDLTGLERCTNLENLSLNENEISDIRPLSGLSHLTHLYLDGNAISDFSPLAGIGNASSNLYIYARSQEAQGKGMIRTSEEVTLSVPLRYRAGKTFMISDFLPLGANGQYAPASGTVSYKPFLTGTEASYRFLLEDETSGSYRKSVYLSGKVTHTVDVVLCDVTFDGVGGNLSGADRQSLMQGYPLMTFPAATRTGYSFAGWRSDGGEMIKAGYVVTTSQRIQATWTANSYRVFYEPGRGNVSAAYKDVTFDQAYGILALPTRAGYGFGGWCLDADGKYKVGQDTIYQKAEDTSLYAIWNPNSYQITFDAQGGTPSSSAKTVTYDDIYGALPQPKWTGKRFEGWYTAPAGGTKVNETDDVTAAYNQTFYAHWRVMKKPPAAITPVFADTWKDIGTYRYYFSKKGLPITGLRKVGKYYYYFDTIGRMQKGRTIALSGYKLKLDKDGRVTNMPRPNRTTLVQAKRKKGSRIQVSWHGLIGASGYQVQFALDKKFKKEIGFVTVRGGEKKAVALTRMAKGKRYYVRVRGYFTIGGLRIPGKYSRPVRSKRCVSAVR